MKRLPKMLCALILCALMVTAAVSCGQKPAQQLQDPPQQEDPQPAPALKIAVDSEPARSAVIHWFYSEEGQALFGDKDLNDVLFSVDPRDIAQELKLGNYDAAVCAPDQKALQLLGGEPFEPENQRELLPFIKNVKVLYPNKTIWCYTGNNLEHEIWQPGPGRCEVTDEFLQYIDVLVDGDFVQDQYDISLRFRGSSNQRIIDMNKTRAAGRVVLWQDDPIFADHKM